MRKNRLLKFCTVAGIFLLFSIINFNFFGQKDDWIIIIMFLVVILLHYSILFIVTMIKLPTLTSMSRIFCFSIFFPSMLIVLQTILFYFLFKKPFIFGFLDGVIVFRKFFFDFGECVSIIPVCISGFLYWTKKPVMKISRERARQILYGLVTCAAIGIGLTWSTYHVQSQGVCLTSMRVLSSEELQRALLVDIINDRLVSAYNINLHRGHDLNWAGIGEFTIKPNLLEMVKEASGNEKSFDENFGLKVLLKGQNDNIAPKKIKENDLPERFMFVSYGKMGGGWGVFIFSDEVQEIPFNNLKPDYRTAAMLDISFFDRLRGFGNHYFLYDPPSIYVDCCDNRYKDLEEYKKIKQSALDYTLSTLDTSAKRKEAYPRIVFVSNCGKSMNREVGDFSKIVLPVPDTSSDDAKP